MKRYLTLLFFAGASAPLFAQALPSDAPAPTQPVRTAVELAAPKPEAATMSSAPTAAEVNAVAAPAATAASETAPAAEASPAPSASIAPTSATATPAPADVIDERARMHRESPQGGVDKSNTR